MFDSIYILRNGRIVNDGSFVGLRQCSVLFQEMWANQKEAPQTEERLEA
ncbi:hypothetical protein [Spirosoma fluminis]